MPGPLTLGGDQRPSAAVWEETAGRDQRLGGTAGISAMSTAPSSHHRACMAAAPESPDRTRRYVFNDGARPGLRAGQADEAPVFDPPEVAEASALSERTEALALGFD